MQDREKMARALSERLKARHKLVKVARQIVQQMPETSHPVGIDDVSYADCSQAGLEYKCHSGYMYSNPCAPYCTGSKAFVCQKFACDTAGVAFRCENTLDHACTDHFVCSFYTQNNEHFCKGDHGFFCDDDFQCYGLFTCKGGGKDCVPPSAYDLEDGKDPAPGDFTCGWPGGDPDDFTCNSDFSCQSLDDFRCVDSTDFDCGTGDPADSFTCGMTGETTQFQCDGTDFACSPMSKFGCSVEVQCKTSTPFTCASYNCPEQATYKNEDF